VFTVVLIHEGNRVLPLSLRFLHTIVTNGAIRCHDDGGECLHGQRVPLGATWTSFPFYVKASDSVSRRWVTRCMRHLRHCNGNGEILVDDVHVASSECVTIQVKVICGSKMEPAFAFRVGHSSAIKWERSQAPKSH
jgi:hypothetical protein